MDQVPLDYFLNPRSLMFTTYSFLWKNKMHWQILQTLDIEQEM